MREDLVSRPKLKTIIAESHEPNGKIFMQWIPGHSDTPGNNMADGLAKKRI